MKASIVVLTKNPGQVFQQVLSSVLRQKAEFDFEVLVIDSGSTDNTLDHIKALADSRIRLHQLAPSEFGHGKTRNLAVSLARGEFVAMLTHDACPEGDGWLKTLVQIAETDVRIAGVFGRHIAYPDANPFTRHELEIHFAGFRSAPVVQMSDPHRYAVDPGYRQFLHFFSDNNALLRKSVWEQIPYPDVDFAEDQLWAKAVIEAGWRKAYADDAAVLHSHNYELVERLQRSFDESRAFFRYFGYGLCPTLKCVLLGWLALNRRDLEFARGQKLLWQAPLSAVRMIADNFMRVAGQYLGNHAERLPASLQLWLSRDKKMHMDIKYTSTKQA